MDFFLKINVFGKLVVGGCWCGWQGQEPNSNHQSKHWIEIGEYNLKCTEKM